MSDYEIEDGHEMPRRRGKYPFGELEVGQSFFVPHDDHGAGNTNGRTPRVALAAFYYGKRRGKKFTSRKQPCGGYRVWRVS